MKVMMLRTMLYMLPKLLARSGRKFPVQAAALARHDATVQIQTMDGVASRWYRFKGGRITSGAGILPDVDVRVLFKDVPTALKLLKVPTDRGAVIHAAKNFSVLQIGPDHLVQWFHELVNNMAMLPTEFGTKMPDGTTRYAHNDNGGVTHVYVKDGKIVRITPIDLQAGDAASFTIKARGKTFSPRRRAIGNPHTLNAKSQIYSDRRLLYPMKRVDWDPNGERNPQNRGKSGYVRISWDEALSLVAKEIERQNRTHGPGAMALWHCSHHQWGNVGYYLSAMLRFANLIGFTRVHTIRTAGKAGTGAPRTTTAPQCASASPPSIPPSRTRCRTLK
jgi:trimethylamine-N-oxide reductase (cytochrome c)